MLFSQLACKKSSTIVDLSKLCGGSVVEVSPVVVNEQSSSINVQPLTSYLPSFYDLSSNVGWPSVKDQGAWGTCVSVTMANAIEWVAHRSSPVSSMYIHYNTQARLSDVDVYRVTAGTDSNLTIQKFVVDDTTNAVGFDAAISGAPSVVGNQAADAESENYSFLTSGVVILAALAAVDIFGFVDDALDPYPAGTFLVPAADDTANAVDTVAADAVPTEVDYDEGVRKSHSVPYTFLNGLYSGDELVDAVKYCIACRNSPVVIGWQVSYQQRVLAMSNGGTFGAPGAGDYDMGGHCSMLCGYDDEISCFLLMNTWGTGVGLSQNPGYYHISYGYIADPNWCFDVFALMPMSVFANWNQGSTSTTPTSVSKPTYVPGSVPSPLIVGLRVSDSYDLFDLTDMFDNGWTFSAVSTVQNVSIVNSITLIVYHTQPYRTQTYKITITASNSAGSCTKTFDVHEGPMSPNESVLDSISIGLSNLISQSQNLWASVVESDRIYKNFLPDVNDGRRRKEQEEKERHHGFFRKDHV